MSEWKLDICNAWGLSVLLLALRWWDISLAHSVECWILNLEAPGSIPAWGEIVYFYISSLSRYTI